MRYKALILEPLNADPGPQALNIHAYFLCAG